MTTMSPSTKDRLRKNLKTFSITNFMSEQPLQEKKTSVKILQDVKKRESTKNLAQ